MTTLTGRRAVLRALSSAAAALAVKSTLDAAREAAKRPNILVLFTDDQRYSAVAAFGCPELRTPNMDRLAASGTAFQRAYIMGGTSGAVCIPSRAMLLTGRSMFRLQGVGEVIPPDHVMLSEILRQAGYATFITGKWHQDKDSLRRGFDAGGPIFLGGMSDHYGAPLQPFDPTGVYPKNAILEDKNRHDSEIFSSHAIDFLRNHKKDRPFFLYVAYKAPHDPREAPERFRAMYDPEKLPLPPNYLPQHPFDNGEMKVRDELLAKFPRTPGEVRRHLADYYAITSHLDFEIGRVLDALKETGHADDTIVVFAGDNGLALGQHGLMGKQSLYEHSIHQPLIFSGPGIPRGSRTDAFCYLLDVYPTLCDLAGVKAPASVDGLSLKPVISGEKKAVRSALCYGYRHFQRAVRQGDWKLILYCVNGKKTSQLFNLKDDPWEMNDLATDMAHAGRVEELTALLQAELAKAGDKADLSKPDWGLPAAKGDGKKNEGRSEE